MKLEILERDGLTLYAGTVEEVRQGTGNLEGRVVFVKLGGKVWNREANQEEDASVEIGFWNPTDPTGDWQNLATRIYESGITTGSFLSVLCRKSENHINAVRFKRSGIWNFPASDDGEMKERNVIIGTMASMKEKDDGSVRFSVPIYHGQDADTEWVYVTFRNSQYGNMADRTKVCLSPKNGQHVKALLVCGPKSEYGNDDSPAVFYSGYRFEII